MNEWLTELASWAWPPEVLFFDGEGAGAQAHLPTALVGLAVVDVALVGAARWLKRRAATPVRAPELSGVK